MLIYYVKVSMNKRSRWSFTVPNALLGTSGSEIVDNSTT